MPPFFYLKTSPKAMLFKPLFLCHEGPRAQRKGRIRVLLSASVSWRPTLLSAKT
jgi:hypothetical protein